MMAKGTVNKVILLGRLGQDPDIRATAGGTQVASISIATNGLGPKNESGQRETATEWHRVVLWGRTAEIAAQYLKKGSQVYIEGRMSTRKWQDQGGIDRYTTEVVANEMQLLGGNNQTGGAPHPSQQPDSYQYQHPDQQPPQNPAQQQPNAGPGPTSFDDFDDGIPF
jgi:single-strand DNA-binding protein